MYDICTIGHITLDKVVTTQAVKHMPGGTSFYFSKALKNLDPNYILITALAQKEHAVVDTLRAEGLEVCSLESEHTVYFENIYSANQNHREQNVLHKAAPFSIDRMPDIAAKYFHLGPLLSDDIPPVLVQQLASKGTVSLDIQGYLREVKDKKVLFKDWVDKEFVLSYISILKANEFEMEVVTGTSNIEQGARYLADLGVKEVIITLGSNGSVIFTNGVFYPIPAFCPNEVVDATGCGDTYMAGYLWKRSQGATVQEAGTFGAAMATLNIQVSGPYSGSLTEIESIIQEGMHNPEKMIVPDLVTSTN